MRRISSRATFFYKRVLPVFWFGYWITCLVGALGIIGGSEPYLPAILFCGLIVIFSLWMMIRFIWDLADMVWDDGDALIVREGRRQERILFSHIIDVSRIWMSRPSRLTVRLRTPSIFGKTFTFSPARGPCFDPQGPGELGLIERIAVAQEK